MVGCPENSESEIGAQTTHLKSTRKHNRNGNNPNKNKTFEITDAECICVDGTKKK